MFRIVETRVIQKSGCLPRFIKKKILKWKTGLEAIKTIFFFVCFIFKNTKIYFKLQNKKHKRITSGLLKLAFNSTSKNFENPGRISPEFSGFNQKNLNNSKFGPIFFFFYIFP